jgi:hypothetical protein
MDIFERAKYLDEMIRTKGPNPVYLAEYERLIQRCPQLHFNLRQVLRKHSDSLDEEQLGQFYNGEGATLAGVDFMPYCWYHPGCFD